MKQNLKEAFEEPCNTLNLRSGDSCQSFNGNLGGLSVEDLKRQQAADNANLGGIWKGVVKR